MKTKVKPKRSSSKPRDGKHCQGTRKRQRGILPRNERRRDPVNRLADLWPSEHNQFPSLQDRSL